VNKKYFPFLFLIAAILLFVWVKKNQRGESPFGKDRTEQTGATGTDFDRNISHIVYSKHARCRMDCREIDESEVKEILEKGMLNKSKIETSSKGTSYPLEGRTHDGQKVRIVFAPKADKIVVVTVIDLEKEFQCDCN
jgi:hypothetical protein